MKTISKIITLALVSILTTGCAIKNTDSAAEKGIKHTLNAPGYVVLGVGALGTAAVMLPFIAVGKGVQAVKGSDNTTQTVEVKETTPVM